MTATPQRRHGGSAPSSSGLQAPISSSGGSPPRTPTAANNTNSVSTTILPLRLLTKLPTIVTILIRVLLWPLFKIVNIIFPLKEYDGINNNAACDRAARTFVAMFQKHISLIRPAVGNGNSSDNSDDNNQQEHYVEPACPFSARGYSSTLAEVTNRPINSRPLLLLYLHSPLHLDGTKFIQEYLCHSQLLQLLNANNTNNNDNGGGGSVVCFGASVHTADGQKIRDMLGVTSFPFMAVVNVKSTSANSNTTTPVPELLLRMEGPKLLTIPPSQVTTYLNTTITRHAEVLAMEEARRLQREEDARLREEQNREFQETLLADQMRELQRQETMERERREREEKEEEERLKVAQEASRLADAKSIIDKASEPLVSMKQGVVRLRFTLPNGKKVDRRFHATDTIEVIRAYLIVYFDEESIEIKNFGLSTNFPRKTYCDEDNSSTLEEAGLAPQAVVMVQDLDA